MIVVNQKPIFPYIVFDIDGTLADIKHRLHHIINPEEKKDWEAFNAASEYDALNKHIAAINYRMCGRSRYGSIIVSGRSENYRSITEKWLLQHNIYCDYIFMRQSGDFRSDAIIKEEIIINNIKDAPILFVVDDRDRVVEVWRKHGYKCLQCQKGDY